MKTTNVTLVPLTEDDREQFILDNQWAFKYGAMMEFGARDDHTPTYLEVCSTRPKPFDIRTALVCRRGRFFVYYLSNDGFIA